MAAAKITKAVDELVCDTKNQFVAQVEAYLKNKLDIESDDFSDLMASMKAKLDLKAKPAGGKPVKEKGANKRGPTAYNLFVKAKCAELKAAGITENVLALARQAYQIEHADTIAANKAKKNKKKVEEVVEEEEEEKDEEKEEEEKVVEVEEEEEEDVPEPPKKGKKGGRPKKA